MELLPLVREEQSKLALKDANDAQVGSSVNRNLASFLVPELNYSCRKPKEKLTLYLRILSVE